MSALDPHLFQPPVSDENEIRKLVVSHFLPDHVVLQWRPATGEDIPTNNTNEIVVFASFFHMGSVSQSVISSADSWITTKLSLFILTLTPFFKSLFSSIFVTFSLGFLLTSLFQKLLLEVPTECRQPEGCWGRWSPDLPSYWLPRSSLENVFSRMAWDMVLLRES
jgi:hypothetical protein